MFGSTTVPVPAALTRSSACCVAAAWTWLCTVPPDKPRTNRLLYSSSNSERADCHCPATCPCQGMSRPSNRCSSLGSSGLGGCCKSSHRCRRSRRRCPCSRCKRRGSRFFCASCSTTMLLVHARLTVGLVVALRAPTVRQPRRSAVSRKHRLSAQTPGQTLAWAPTRIPVQRPVEMAVVRVMIRVLDFALQLAIWTGTTWPTRATSRARDRCLL